MPSTLSRQRLAGGERRARLRPSVLREFRGGRAAVAAKIPYSLPHVTYDRQRAPATVDPAAECAHLIADRVSLPTAGAVVLVAPWVPPDWQTRLARPDELLRADCRAAFGFPVRPDDPVQLDEASVGRLIPRPAFLSINLSIAQSVAIKAICRLRFAASGWSFSVTRASCRSIL